METVEQLGEEVNCLYDQCLHPFPYGDLETLRRITKKRWSGLNPDLDMYQSTIAGYCSWDRKSSRWTPERTQQLKQDLARDFFEQHPQYLPLKRLISPRLTPKLYTDSVHYELMRKTVLRLANLIEQNHIRTERIASQLQHDPILLEPDMELKQIA